MNGAFKKTRRAPSASSTLNRRNRHAPPPAAPVHARDRDPEGPPGRGRLELARPEKVSLAYTRGLALAQPRRVPRRAAQEIVAFLTRKWARELDYRLIKELWAFDGNRIAVRFAYEWHDDSGNWFRSYGNENWEFDDERPDAPPPREHQRPADRGIASASTTGRSGRRPDDHPGLSDLGL